MFMIFSIPATIQMYGLQINSEYGTNSTLQKLDNIVKNNIIFCFQKN